MQSKGTHASLASSTPACVLGLDQALALWKLLQLQDVDITWHEMRDWETFDGTPEAMVRVLLEHGISGRLAVVENEDLAYLHHPTLLQARGGQWFVLHRWDGRRMVLEGRDGLFLTLPDEMSSVLSGHVLDLSPSLSLEGGIWGRLGSIVARHQRILVQIGLAALCMQLLALLAPWITGLVLDQALPEGAASMLDLTAMGVVVVALFRAGIGWLRQRLVLFLVTRLEIAAERSFLEHLLGLPFPFLQRKTLGDFLQAFSGMVVTRDLLGEVFFGAALDAFLGIGYLVVMGFKLLVPTIVVVFVALLMGALAAFVGRAQARQQALEVDIRAKEQGYLTEMLKGIGTVKAAGAESTSLERWMRLLRRATKHSLKRQRQGLWSEVGLEVMRQGLTIALLIWGGALILQGQLTVGSLFAFVAMTSGFIASVLSLVNAYLTLVVIRPQLAKTMEILEVDTEPRNTGRALADLRGPVLMEDVWFRYAPDRPWILKGYDLAIERGETCTITGPSGFGKSTVLRLLAGLYVPERGTISIGGLSPTAARSQLLYLPQFVQLYGGSLMENLRVISGNAPLERILETAELTGLAKFVQQLPMGLQTILPNGGGAFSGGQRQLIALSAAIASSAPVLILDEPMANLDARTCRKLWGILNDVKKTNCIANHVQCI